MSDNERRDYRRLYSEDDGPLYDGKFRQSEPWGGWDWVILAIFLIAIVVFACSAPLIMF